MRSLVLTINSIYLVSLLLAAKCNPGPQGLSVIETWFVETDTMQLQVRRVELKRELKLGHCLQMRHSDPYFNPIVTIFWTSCIVHVCQPVLTFIIASVSVLGLCSSQSGLLYFLTLFQPEAGKILWSQASKLDKPIKHELPRSDMWKQINFIKQFNGHSSSNYSTWRSPVLLLVTNYDLWNLHWSVNHFNRRVKTRYFTVLLFASPTLIRMQK